MNNTLINFDFISPKIIFGRGKIELIGKETIKILKAKEIKNIRVLLVTGKSSLKKSGYLDKIDKCLAKNGITSYLYDKVVKEPTTEIVNYGKKFALDNNCHLVIGIGGGSVMDTAKAIAGLISNGGIVEDYHAGKEFVKPPLPFILVPTTSGTGSEITNNAVIKDEKIGIKKSVRGLLANTALLDPELTLPLPKPYTAYSGADALVQAIESLVSKSANFISDFFAKKAIKILGLTLPKVVKNLNNIQLREEMMLGSLFDALSFSNGKLGMVHGFAHPIGIKFDIPHGLICGTLLPYVMEYNLEVNSVVKKYAWIADTLSAQKILQGYGNCPEQLPMESFKKAEWAIWKLKDIFLYIGIPLHLNQIGIKESDISDIVQDTKGSSLDNNPRTPTKESLIEILRNAL
ncbi:MAG: iron-containing alcohol dehydrogenase [Candidatus Lokiarchaeota archaeon]|jgi:alcohol dehydrogenase class IV